MDVLAALAVGLVVAGGPVALERVTTLDLPGLDPGGVVVNRDTHDLVIWECENDKVSFVEAAFNRLAGTFAFQLAEETVSSSGDTFQDCAIFYDPQSRLVHYVGQSSGTTSFSINFERVFVWSLRDRASIGAVFINPDGDTPSSAPEDFRFVINGIGFKPAGADGNANARLIIDDTIKGNLHVVDVDQFGNSTAINRYSYRARHESSCQWPDIDPGPFYSCSFDTPDGSGLALDWGRSPDELFMADHLFNPFLVRRFQVNGAPAEAASINVFDLSGSFGTGAQSLHALPGDDRLLVLTAAESFDEGLIIELDTSSFGLNGIFFDFRDLRAVAVDPSDPSHFFVPVQDFEFSTSVGPLLVREFRGQSEVASILVNSDYDASFNDPVLAFDPDYQLLYVASEDRIDVFRTGQPQGPFPNPDRDDVEAPSPVSIGSGDRFGSAVALAGNLLAVGAPNNSDGLNTGTVSIFRREGNGLVREALLTTPAGFAADGFGTALALQGNRLVVGAPGITSPGKGLSALQAAIFERTSQAWDFKAAVSPGDGQSGDEFGAAVALDGDQIAVGAPASGGTGAVYVFDFANNVATQTDKGVPSHSASGDRVGAAVAINKGQLAVGAPGKRLSGQSAGAATVFALIAGNLSERGSVTGDAGDDFGSSVSVQGSLMIVGAPGADGETTDEGRAVVFQVGSQLRQVTVLTAGDPRSGARFGEAVSAGRQFLGVGAPGASSTQGDTGAGYLFSASGTPILLEKLETDSTVQSLGEAMVVDGVNAVLGAPLSASNRGAARLFLDVQEVWRNGFE